MKAIVADDSRIICKVAASVTQGLGYETVQAADGREVLDILEKDYETVKLVLLDWNMPRINGLEVLKAMQQDSRMQSIPVIIVTVEPDEETIQQALAAGAKSYMTKPFTKDELSMKIMEMDI
jgi:two-component system, chemotaxis family, chemotaxis protein CheY